MEAVQAPSSYELERGKPMPSTNHSVIQASIIGALLRFADEYTILSELSLRLGGKPYVPDISIYRRLSFDPLQDQIEMTEPPLLAIEILSPTQPLDNLIQKARVYLEAGVESCWIVQPSLETITVFQTGKKARTHTTGDVKDPATGITVTMDEVFRAFH